MREGNYEQVWGVGGKTGGRGARRTRACVSKGEAESSSLSPVIQLRSPSAV